MLFEDFNFSVSLYPLTTPKSVVFWSMQFQESENASYGLFLVYVKVEERVGISCYETKFDRFLRRVYYFLIKPSRNFFI